MKRRDLIAALVLASLGTPALAAVKQISILHSGFPNRTPIHLLIEVLGTIGVLRRSPAFFSWNSPLGYKTRVRHKGYIFIYSCRRATTGCTLVARLAGI